MQSTPVENRAEPKTSTRFPAADRLEKTFKNPETANIFEDYEGNLKRKLTDEIKAYKVEKNKELNWARRLNRWSIGTALVLTAATTICGASQEDKIKELVTPLGTLAVTLNGWIASVPMSKRVSLYERTLVKADNLRSDLEFEVKTEDDIEKIREDFKSLKIEFIQENPREQLKHHSVQSATPTATLKS